MMSRSPSIPNSDNKEHSNIASPEQGKGPSALQPAEPKAEGDGETKLVTTSSPSTQRSDMNTQKKTSETGKTNGESQNAIELLKADHQEVDKMFEQFKTARGRSQRKKLVEKIATALNAHTIIEEEIFYPACREHDVEEDDLDEAQVEHDTIKLLVRELLNGNLDDDYYDAKMTVLSEYVKHHVKEEEEPEKGIFARIQKTDADLDELGQELKERKDELMEDREELVERPPRIRSLQLGGRIDRERSRSGGRTYSGGAYRQGEEEESGGARYYQSGDRERDSRFGGSSRQYRGEGGYGGGPGRGYGFESDEGHGGWYGDRDGHSEAARRGWRHRDN